MTTFLTNTIRCFWLLSVVFGFYPLSHQKKLQKMEYSSFGYKLEKYRSYPKNRYQCPYCSAEGTWTRYYNEEKQLYLPYEVGRCDREKKCQAHYKAHEFFRDHPEAVKKYIDGEGGDWLNSDAWKTTYKPPEEMPAPTPVDYLPIDVMKATFKGYAENNFIRFLSGFFGPGEALELARIYNLGTSKKYINHGGKAVVFWQVDINGNIRQAKIMAYHPDTGKRIKEDGRNYISFAGKAILKNKGANLQQCFFGEHLLSDRPTDKVAIVESEKTAVIMAGIYPEVVWIATGGVNGARWTDKQVYGALADRDVIIYPDLDAFKDWKRKAKALSTICNCEVSDLLEQSAAGQDWAKGYDIADYFIDNKLTTPANGNEAQAIQDEEKRLGMT